MINNFLPLSRVKREIISFEKLFGKKKFNFKCPICSRITTTKSKEVLEFSNTQYLIIRLSVSIIEHGQYLRYKTKISNFRPELVSIGNFNFKMKAAIKHYGAETHGNSGHFTCIVPEES
jgi:hypothetical protein